MNFRGNQKLFDIICDLIENYYPLLHFQNLPVMFKILEDPVWLNKTKMRDKH